MRDILLVIGLVIILGIGMGCLMHKYGPQTEEELEAYLTDVRQGVEYINVMQGQISSCEHEFVITSKYNWFLRSYKTISRCIKCGMET